MGAEQSRLPPRSPTENSSGERAEAWSRPDDFLEASGMQQNHRDAQYHRAEQPPVETPTLEDSSAASSSSPRHPTACGFVSTCSTILSRRSSESRR